MNKHTGRKWSEVSNSNIAVVGHRGATLVFPENTMIGYDYTASVSDGIVGYAWTTLDGVYVSIHDSTLDRSTNVSGTIANTRYGIIKTANAAICAAQIPSHPDFSAGLLPFQHVPTIAEILDRFGGKTLIYLAACDETAAIGIAEMVTARNLQDYVILFSWNPIINSQILCKDPTLKIAFTIGGSLPTVASLVAAGYWAVGVNKDNATESFISDCHTAGLKVYGYVPNNLVDAEYLYNLGVDILETDDPSYIKNGLKKEITLPFTLTMPKRKIGSNLIGSGHRITDANTKYPVFYPAGTMPSITPNGAGWAEGNTGNVAFGLGIKTPDTNYKINFSVKIKSLSNVLSHHFGIFFCSDKDDVNPAFQAPYDMNQNSYVFQYTAFGNAYLETLFDDRQHTYISGVFSAYTNEDVIPLQIEVTDTTVTARRTDNSNTMTLTTSDFNRNGYIAFYSCRQGVVFGDVTVSAL